MQPLKFTVLRDHIKLARQMRFEWDETIPLGRLASDSKRPYGDGDIPRSVAEAINLDFVEESNGQLFLNGQQEKYCLKLHRDMETVMQIICSTGQFKSGNYEREEYTNNWKRIN